MKKLITIVFAAVIIVSAAGCVDGRVEVVNPYRDSSDDVTYTSDLKVKDYDELKNAVYTVLSKGSETEMIRVVGYDGDIEKIERDLEEICDDILQNTEIGKYAVNYLSGSVNQIVSYYDAKISVSYKIEPAEMRNIYFIFNQAALDNTASDLMKSLRSAATLYIIGGGEETLDIKKTFEDVYLKYPLNSIYKPVLSLTTTGNEERGRLIKINISYSKNSAEIISQRDRLQREIASILQMAGNDNQAETVFNIAEILCSELTLEEGEVQSTVYGTIGQKRANDLGLSLAFKAVCDRAGIECFVVPGEMGAAEHYWNVIKVDGSFFHIDLFRCKQSGYEEYFLKSDSDFEVQYSWDRDLYPECSRQSDFGYLFEMQ